MKDIIQMYKKYKRKKMLSSMMDFYSLDKTSFLMDDFNLRLDFPVKNHKFLEIGKDCIIGAPTFISNSEIIIEDNGAIVGAGSVVAKDVEPWTVVAGNPAKIVKRLK